MSDGRELRERQWWRFDRYEVVAGILRPCADAEPVAYLPWFDYITGRKRKKIDRSPAPYQDLLALAHALWDPDSDGSYADLNAEQQQVVVDWASRYGLLGLWHHEALLALFPDTPGDGGRVRLRGYERVPWGWRQVDGGFVERRATARTGPVRGHRLPDALVAAMPKDVWRDALPAGGFLLRDLPTGAISTTPLDSQWRLYFDERGPLGKAVWPIPSPDSVEFWRSYGEPVAMIVFVANELARSIDPGLDSQMTTLNNFAAPAAPALVHSPEGLSWGLDSPSLVASMAAMIIADLAGGARPVVCPCGVPFLTRAYQSAYCSVQCKNTAHTKRRRAEAEKLKAEELSNSGA